jgi:hypothetical protein
VDILKMAGTGVVAALLAFWLTQRRDRKARKKNFLKFIKVWRTYFASKLDIKAAQGGQADHYVQTVGNFQAEAILVEDDLPPKFRDLVKQASSFNGGQMSKKENQEELIRLLDEISELVRKS